MTDLIENIVSNSDRFINILTDEFNLSITDIQKKRRDVMWGENITEEFLISLGYAKVNPRASEGVGNYVQTTPVLENGAYYQSWKLATPSPLDLERQLTQAKKDTETIIQSYVSKSLERGVVYNFGTESEPLNLHIQIRDADRLNVLGMSIKAQRVPGLIQYFRTGENQMTPVTEAQVIEMSNQSYAGYVAIKSAEWSLIDAIRSAQTINDIPAIPQSLREFYETNAGLTWIE